MNKDLYFEYIEEFAEYIVERVENDEDLFLTVVGKFENIKNILKEIFTIAYVNFDYINLAAPDLDEYTDEYILDCWCTDGIVQVGCEPAKRDGKYLNIISEETYLLEDCSSKVIALYEDLDLHFVNFDEECDCEEECDECCCDCNCGDSCVEYSKTDDNELHGFTASRSTGNGYHSYSFYTNDNLSKSDIHDMLKKFGF